MMKIKKIVLMGTLMMVSLFPFSGQAVNFVPAEIGALVAAKHQVPLAASVVGFDSLFSIWIDPGMVAATGVDLLATKKHDERTIDAKNAIKKLEEALGGGCGGGSAGDGNASGDSSLATVYTADQVSAKINVTQTSGADLFDNAREAINEFLFETAMGDIKGGCTQSDKDCATERQEEWLLASITLASATADKVLDKTNKQNGKTTLMAHFQTLASNFNAETSPTGLYNRMADIVLDTHRQINDANALLGRDLEAQGLRAVAETGPVLLDGSKTEE